jgi:hypothetical protein
MKGIFDRDSNVFVKTKHHSSPPCVLITTRIPQSVAELRFYHNVTFNMIQWTAALLLTLTTTGSTLAFQSPGVQVVRTNPYENNRHSVNGGGRRYRSPILSAIPPTESIADLVTTWSTNHPNFFVLLADASSSTTAGGAVTAAEDSGWWASYLNIFKTCLLLVHNTIDQPLRSVGVTQTWGLSIAIFTACKSNCRSACLL